MRIYIESTIPSYVVARPARDLLQAARQQLTRDWWDSKREAHELFTSQVVLDEIAFGEKEMAERRLHLVEGMPLLQVTAEVKELAGKVLSSGLLPLTADRDATHIALASAYELDILLTWNCRHIANPMIQQRLRRWFRQPVSRFRSFVRRKNCWKAKMSKVTKRETKTQRGDLVLQEVWRAKYTLSAGYGHDLDKLFEETRKREKLSGHPLANLPIKRREV